MAPVLARGDLVDGLLAVHAQAAVAVEAEDDSTTAVRGAMDVDGACAIPSVDRSQASRAASDMRSGPSSVDGSFVQLASRSYRFPPLRWDLCRTMARPLSDWSPVGRRDESARCEIDPSAGGGQCLHRDSSLRAFQPFP